ncbi:MAG: anthranilate synthase component I family protein [Leptospirillia bacterium]
MKKNRHPHSRNSGPGRSEILSFPSFDPVSLLFRLRERDPGIPLIHIDRERSTGWSHVPVTISRTIEDRTGEALFDHPLLSDPVEEGESLVRRESEGLSPFSSGVVLLLPFEMAERWEPSGGPFLAPEIPALRCDCPEVISFHAPSGRLFLPAGFDRSLLAPVAFPPPSPLTFLPEDSEAEFRRSLAKIREGLLEGRYFQVNLARRFSAELPAGFDPLAAYARLRALGPSPFGGFFSWRGRVLLSRSPEQFLEAESSCVVTRPIAGTAPGTAPEGPDPLLCDPKLLAEHIMTVDLLRNDLGKVCRPGSVRVPRFLAVERLPHLRHLVSDVEGLLAPGLTRSDLLRSLFPGGSVTGAPRIAVRREIGRLEGRPRNDYCGVFGSLSGGGRLDLALLIRTLEGRLAGPYGRGSGRISFGAGAGIVADSVAEEEIREIALKARTMEEVFRG